MKEVNRTREINRLIETKFGVKYFQSISLAEGLSDVFKSRTFRTWRSYILNVDDPIFKDDTDLILPISKIPRRIDWVLLSVGASLLLLQSDTKPVESKIPKVIPISAAVSRANIYSPDCAVLVQYGYCAIPLSNDGQIHLATRRECADINSQQGYLRSPYINCDAQGRLIKWGDR